MPRLLTTIPVDADGIVIQYDPNWRVTCATKRRVRPLMSAYGNVEVEIPEMIFTATRAPNLDKAKTYYSAQMKGIGYNTMILEKEENERILGRSWPIGTHTCDNGSICWGANPYPIDLRSAFQQFWQSRFNADLEKAKDKSAEYFEKCFKEKRFRVRDLTFRVMGKKRVVPDQPVDIVLITSEPEDIALAPDEVTDGPSVPADDLLDYGYGGYGANDGRKTPTDMEWAEAEIRLYMEGKKSEEIQYLKSHDYHRHIPDTVYSLIPQPKEMGKVLIGMGHRRTDDKYVIQLQKTSLVYDPATEKLTKD